MYLNINVFYFYASKRKIVFKSL
jgi:hypothetical protein